MELWNINQTALKLCRTSYGKYEYEKPSLSSQQQTCRLIIKINNKISYQLQ